MDVSFSDLSRYSYTIYKPKHILKKKIQTSEVIWLFVKYKSVAQGCIQPIQSLRKLNHAKRNEKFAIPLQWLKSSPTQALFTLVYKLCRTFQLF